MSWSVKVRIKVSILFFFKQKTAYDMRISDWSSDVCSSDLLIGVHLQENQLNVSEVKRFWLHQANLSMNHLIVRKLLGREATEEEAPVILDQIGRASCRERVCRSVEITVGAVPLKHKQIRDQPGPAQTDTKQQKDSRM